MMPDQKKDFDGFVRDFPPGQHVHYLLTLTPSTNARVITVYWNDTFHETWLEVEVWDDVIEDYRECANLPAMLFMRNEETDAEKKAIHAREKSANT
jgi:hypothetical protein